MCGNIAVLRSFNESQAMEGDGWFVKGKRLHLTRLLLC